MQKYVGHRPRFCISFDMVIVRTHMHTQETDCYTWTTGRSDLRGQLCLSRQPLQYTALGAGCAPLLFRGTVKLLPVYGLSISNNNKWRWWMWMVAASFRRTHSPNLLAWSECWRPPGAQSAFIKWTGWNDFGPDNSVTNIVVVITIILIKSGW